MRSKEKTNLIVYNSLLFFFAKTFFALSLLINIFLIHKHFFRKKNGNEEKIDRNIKYLGLLVEGTGITGFFQAKI